MSDCRQWETIAYENGPSVLRTPVPGGWLYAVRNQVGLSVAHVPEPAPADPPAAAVPDGQMLVSSVEYAWLRHFYAESDFGPADGDVRRAMKERYVRLGGVPCFECGECGQSLEVEVLDGKPAGLFCPDCSRA